MDTLLQDLRFALRQLLRSPGFTAAAVLTLALGIGANTTIFSMVNAVLFRPIPVADPQDLARLYTSEWERSGIPTRLYGSSSYPDYLDIRGLDVFAGVAAYDVSGVSLVAEGEARLVPAALVSDDFFAAYGVRATLGRTFSAVDVARPELAQLAVLTDRAWRREFGGDTAMLGRAVPVNGQSFVILGVVPHDALAPLSDAGVDVILPLAAYPLLWGDAEILRQRSSRWLDLVARLAPGVTIAEAQAALTARGAQLADAYPGESGGRRYTLVGASTLLGFAGAEASEIAGTLAVVMGVVLIVLLIACANVANLLLARATARGREIAIRLSLGAGRARVVRQLLTESVLLAALAAGAAVLLAIWASELFALLPLPAGIQVAVDQRVLAFTAGVALAAGILFGLAPALHATRADAVPALKGGPGGARAGRSRLRSTLLVSQIALSLILLVGAGLLVRTVRNMADADPGFRTERVLTARVNLGVGRYGEAEGRAFYSRLLERAASLPGVRSASLASVVPFSGQRSRRSIVVPGYEPAADEGMEIAVGAVSDDYFRTLGMPIVRGSGFAGARLDGPREVVVNEAFVRRFWRGSEPVGRQIRFGNEEFPGPALTVVGVVRDAQFGDFSVPAYPMIFEQFPAAYSAGLTLYLRTEGDPLLLAGALRQAMRALDPSLPLTAVRPLAEVVAGRAMPFRVSAGFMAGFGALALLLASVGLYGVMSFLVAQRSREIGIRMALGARRAEVARLVLGQGVRLALVGIAIGLLGSLALTRVIAGALYRVSPWDPVTFAGVAVALTLVACVAAYLPARRAASVDPTIAMRAE